MMDLQDFFLHFTSPSDVAFNPAVFTAAAKLKAKSLAEVQGRPSTRGMSLGEVRRKRTLDKWAEEAYEAMRNTPEAMEYVSIVEKAQEARKAERARNAAQKPYTGFDSISGACGYDGD